MNFWNKLKQPLEASGHTTTARLRTVTSGRMTAPIMVLAPMADVTDAAFRRVIAKYGKPDVMWTEFVSADGLFLSPVREYCEKFIKGEINQKELFKSLSNGIGGSNLLQDLIFTESERPIVAQFFTSKPEMMRKAAELACDLGFDGIDINMGCPDKSIEKQGAGAASIKNPKLAQEIILAAMEGAKKTGKNLPVSVKTRIGYTKNELETWLPALLEVNPAVITVHARTRKEMSKVPARWEHVKRAVEIRNEFRDKDGKASETLIFGNGDVKDLEDAKQKVLETGCDGVMLGRAIFGNPWLFSGKLPTTEEKLKVMVEHTKLFSELLPHKSFAIMKKHYKAYVNGFDARPTERFQSFGRGSAELRAKLMEAKDAGEVDSVVTDYLKNGLK